jgi:uncharacterized membrane-anchored protein YitT (DUF2179 family)
VDEAASPRHSAFEDAQGILTGTLLVTLGLAFLQHLGLVTGQVAGLALLVALWTGVPFGAVFFGLNLPFYWLAVKRMGWAFTLKTFVAVGLVTAFSLLRPRFLSFGTLDPLVGVVLAGMVQGAGLLAIFRHRASLGGAGVVAVYLQDRTGFRAGWTQLLVDLLVFALALLTLPLEAVAYSLAGAVVLNLVIAINHRRDRYVAM